ncbi:MAG: carbohydrate binding domain-containing protein [Candidatus Hydrogenedentota bacterium]
MENFSAYSVSGDNGTSYSVDRVDMDGNPAIMHTFTFTTGSWSQIERSFTSLDLTRGDSIRFKYRGGGTNNNLEIKLVDGDTETFGYTLNSVTASPTWQTATVKFEGPSPDFSYWWGGDATTDKTLDTDTIKKIEFAISGNGSGYIIIDDLELYQTKTFTDSTLDDFNDSNNTNNFGGTNGVYVEDATVSCTLSYYETSPYEGARCAKIEYSRGSKYCGAYFPLNSTDLHLATHLQFYIKSEYEGESLKIELGSANKNHKITYYNVPTSWTKVCIVLENYRGGSSEIPDSGWYAMTGNFAIGFEEGISRTSGTVYIDDVKFIRNPPAPGPVFTIDDFEGPYLVAYSTAADNNATITKSQVSGYSGYGLRLDYSMNNGAWVVAYREMYADFNRGTGLRFRLYGGSASKDLEVKIADKDNTVFYKKFLSKTGYAYWQTVDLLFTELSLFSKGDDDDLSLSLVSKIYFAVSGSGSANGSIIIDDLEVLNLGAPGEVVNRGIIQSVLVENNPFSPNDDGVQDYVRFNYNLLEPANVKFEIVDSSGDRIIDLSPSGIQQAGTNSIIWNGKTASNKRVRNGLYLFHIRANGTNGGSGNYTNIVAVVR